MEPTPEKALSMANETPEPIRHVSASDYLDTIRTLRDVKKLTWYEVYQWFKGNGFSFSQGAIRSAYFNNRP